MNHKVVGFILAGGKGNRLGASIPKQFLSLNGKMVIQWVIDNMKSSGLFKDIYIIGDPSFQDYYNKIKDVKFIKLEPLSRVEDTLEACKLIGQDTDYVFIQDSVRPLTPSSHYQQMLKSLSSKTSYDFIITAQFITDVLFKDEITHIEPVDRYDYDLCQCPELFKFNSLKNLPINRTSCNSISEYAYNNGQKGGTCHLDSNNTKITYDYHLFEIEQLLRFSIPKVNNNPDLQGKKILLFGASGDIGSAVKEYCEMKGAIVSAPYRVDMKDDFVWKLEIFDCVINCIGDYCTDENEFSKKYDVFEANITLPLDIIRGSETFWLKKGGSIIILGSTAGLAGRKGFALYGASKAFIHNYIEAYASRLLEKNIKINVIAPAKVVGKLQKTLNPNADEKQMIDPKDLAKLIASYINPEETGKIIPVPVGFQGK